MGKHLMGSTNNTDGERITPATTWTARREKNFWRKVQTNNDQHACWNWTGGYQFRIGTRQVAHAAAAWELSHDYQQLPDGHVAWRACGNLLCPRPSHLLALPLAEFCRATNSTGMCGRGLHRMTPDNTYVTPSGTARPTQRRARRCRACQRAYHKTYYGYGQQQEICP